LLGCDQQNVVGMSVSEVLPESLLDLFRKMDGSADVSCSTTINRREVAVKGRRVSGEDSEDIILVLIEGCRHD
jgi:hypothetical protein